MKLNFSFKNISNNNVLTSLAIGVYDLEGVQKVSFDSQNNEMEMVIQNDFMDKTLKTVSDIIGKIDSNISLDYSTE